MIATVSHPGPISPDRLDILRANGTPVKLTLAAGIPLELAVAEALQEIGCANSAYLELTKANVSELAYVMPAHAADEEHVAWYSEVQRWDGAGVIHHLGMIVGHREHRCFVHGHGTWTPKGGACAMGHILSQMTVLENPAVVTGFALCGARFEGRHDPETNFTLFRPMLHGIAAGTDACFAVLRILPNQDLDIALDTACEVLGWQSARAWGVGSINMPHFSDGRVLDSLPTELLILDAICRADGESSMGAEIRVVGTDPSQIEQGHLARGSNGVLITAEIVLRRET